MDERTRVRTFHAQRGRLSALTRTRLHTLGPAYALPAGAVDSRSACGRSAPVVLEVGCGYGHAALAYAQAHPDHDLIAVDVHPPGIARLLAALEAAGATNVRVELGDAVELLIRRIPASSLAGVHVFFPDPWPKTRHHRRRFFSAENLALLASRLRPEGQVLVATDHAAYAAYVHEQVRRQGDFVSRRVERPSWRPLAGFEAKGVAAGREIVDLRLTRS